jgi:hypothetical protein
MKMENLIRVRTMLLLLVVSSALFLGSCKKDATIVAGDKTALTAAIASADALSAAATSTDYPQTDITTYQATLATVKTAAAPTLTQAQIDNLVIQLNAAMTLLKTKAFAYIDESLYLNAGWHFDEGTGTTATSYAAGKQVATFKGGNKVILGTAAVAAPTWVAGVKGGNAIHVNGGAHLEAPYTTSFLPVNLTISVWVKPDSLYENNYIVSQNFWQGYKLQTQGGGKPFFTYKTSTGAVIDADNETDSSIKKNVWNHIVVSVNATTQEEKIYVDGTLTKTWTNANKGIGPLIQVLAAPAAQPFIIGCVATDDELANDAVVGWMAWTTAANFGYFMGAIDELKIYNIALSDGQVSKLYNDEKP